MPNNKHLYNRNDKDRETINDEEKLDWSLITDEQRHEQAAKLQELLADSRRKLEN